MEYPELRDHELGVAAVAGDQPHGLLPAVAAAAGRRPVSPRGRGTSRRSGPVGPESVQSLRKPVTPARAGGRRARSSAARAEAEQLLQLAGVVLVDVPAAVRRAIEPQQHRRVVRDVDRQPLEVAQRVPAQERVLAQHQLLRHAGLRGREPVVPDERHPLHQRRLRAHRSSHQGGRAPTRRSARAPAVADGMRPAEALRPGARQRLDGPVEPELRELRGLPGGRPKARAPQQPRRLFGTELTENVTA